MRDRSTRRFACRAEPGRCLNDELSGNQLLASLLEGLQTRAGPFLNLGQSRNRDRLLELHYVTQALRDIYTREGAEIWNR